MKTRQLLIFVVICDLFMAAAGIPLERVTLKVLAHPHDRPTIVLLLIANLALFAICVCGFLATSIAGTRGVRYAITRFSKVYARSR